MTKLDTGRKAIDSVLRIHFTSEDLRKVTVAAQPDPLWEVLLSLHTLQDRSAPGAFREWRRKTAAGSTATIRLLADLAPPQGYSPDFLTPGRGDEGFEAQLDYMLSSPRRHLREDFICFAKDHSVTPWIRSLGDGDPVSMRLLGKIVESYHRVALVPYQDRTQALVAVDRDRRGQALLAGGVERLLATLHPRAMWQAPVLRLPIYAEQDLHLGGRGLVLVPSVFCHVQPITLRDADRSPVLVYPVVPPVSLLQLEQEGPDPVVALLGRTRAAVLRAAVSSGTTTQLGHRVGIAPPVVSRHTAVLRAAGLLETRRQGGSVRHCITGLGIAVLNGAALG